MTQDVFPVATLKSLADSHRTAFVNLLTVEKALKKRFYGLDDAIHALMLATACREPLLLIGPPGTAKSHLIRAFCNYLGIKVPERRDDGSTNGAATTAGEWQDAHYFEYLLTPFTEPGELFGYYDITVLKEKGHYVRSDEGMIQKARVVYLDEVFNASSAILNSMLALLNEGRFHDRNTIVKANWQLMLGATNALPDSDALRAVFDRFLLRCQVDNVQVNQGPEELTNLLQVGWPETYRGGARADSVAAFPTLLNDLESFRLDVGRLVAAGLTVQPASPFYGALVTLVNLARDRYQLSDMSNRRLIKFLFVMMVHAIYRYIGSGGDTQALCLGDEELHLLRRYGMDRRDDLADMALSELIRSNPERGR